MRKSFAKHFVIRQLTNIEPVPYKLLQLSEPVRKNIDRDLPLSEIYVAQHKEDVVGAYMFFHAGLDSIELKNVSVDKFYNGHGIEKILVDDACTKAKDKGYKKIETGISNSNLTALDFYQKEGFELTALKKNFFTKNNIEPIIENGIQRKHLLILAKEF